MKTRLGLLLFLSATLFVIPALNAQQTPAEDSDTLIAPVAQQLLSLEKRDDAMRQIIEQQKYRKHENGEGGPPLYKETEFSPVNHVVVCPQPSGPPLFAVFLQGKAGKTKPHRPEGHIILVDSDGAMVPYYHGANVIGAGALGDINDDGVIDVVDWLPLNGATLLYVLPVTPRQTPLLQIVVEGPPRSLRDLNNLKTVWTFRPDREESVFVVRVGQQDLKSGKFTQKAVYKWSAEDNRFIGPDGGPGEGFMRLEKFEDIRRFRQGRAR